MTRRRLTDKILDGFFGDLKASLEDLGASAAAGLHKCLKPDCTRLVSATSAFCCRPCAVAAAADRPWEVEPWQPGRAGPAGVLHMHTEACERRAAERGPHHHP